MQCKQQTGSGSTELHVSFMRTSLTEIRHSGRAAFSLIIKFQRLHAPQQAQGTTTYSLHRLVLLKCMSDLLLKTFRAAVPAVPLLTHSNYSKVFYFCFFSTSSSWLQPHYPPKQDMEYLIQFNFIQGKINRVITYNKRTFVPCRFSSYKHRT